MALSRSHIPDDGGDLRHPRQGAAVLAAVARHHLVALRVLTTADHRHRLQHAELLDALHQVQHILIVLHREGMSLKVVDLLHWQHDHRSQRTLAHDVQPKVLRDAVCVGLIFLLRLLFGLRHTLGALVLRRLLFLRLCRRSGFLILRLCRCGGWLFFGLFLAPLFSRRSHRLRLSLARFLRRSRCSLLRLFLYRLLSGLRLFPRRHRSLLWLRNLAVGRLLVLRGRTAKRPDQRIFLLFCHTFLPPPCTISKPVSI